MKLQTDFKFSWRVVKTFPNAQLVKKNKDNKRDQTLTSPKKGRVIFFGCSKWLNNKLLEGIPICEHSISCQHLLSSLCEL